MKYKAFIILAALSSSLLLFRQCSSEPKVEMTVNEAEKKVDVMVDGKLFTSYIYPDVIKKPVLWPVISPAGNMLTRSFPMVNKEGDRSDHPHHVGVWLNLGKEVWGTRCRWMKLASEINGEQVALVIIDHPSNVGYPTYWHAGDYGLFTANTLGQKIFSEGKNELNFGLKKGESVTFKYRVVVAA